MKHHYDIYDNWTVMFDQPQPMDEVHIIKEKTGTRECKDIYIPRTALLKYAIAELEFELGRLVCRQLINRLMDI